MRPLESRDTCALDRLTATSDVEVGADEIACLVKDRAR
jgi:hypothetical protein